LAYNELSNGHKKIEEAEQVHMGGSNEHIKWGKAETSDHGRVQ
jgi:hypothetical protein